MCIRDRPLASTTATEGSELVHCSATAEDVYKRQVLARDPNSSVFGIVSFAWAGFGGSFGAVVLCSLFWKRCNWQGALAGMLSGGLMVFVWKYICLLYTSALRHHGSLLQCRLEAL